MTTRREDLLSGLGAGLTPPERTWLESARASRIERILARTSDDAASAEARQLIGVHAPELPLVEAWLASRSS
jgi:hypothetical protein